MNKDTMESLLDYRKKARYVMMKLHKEIEELEHINKHLQEELKKCQEQKTFSQSTK